MTPQPACSSSSSSSARPALADLLAERLEALAGVIDRVSDTDYVATPFESVSGSTGAHVRHVLDHAAALVDRAASDVVDYDTRRRGTEIERSRRAAAAEARRLAGLLRLWPAADDDTPLAVSAMVDESGARAALVTTRGRELAFVLSHTIHHEALIATNLAAAGRSAPARFGVAPSTPTRLPNARSA